jgi:hypothetical protein
MPARRDVREEAQTAKSMHDDLLKMYELAKAEVRAT